LNHCPNDDQLHELLSGKEGSEDLGSATEHVEHCQPCQERLERLARDPIVEQWCADSARATDCSGREPTALIAKLKALAPDRIRRDWWGASDTKNGDGETSAGTRDFMGSAAIAVLLGKTGRFRAIREIGGGGFGLVFRACTDLQPEVAVKILRPDRAANERERDRFQREARAAASVADDYVVTVYEVGVTQEPSLPYIVMELLKGESLLDRLKRQGRLAPRDAAQVGRQVALGLDAIHRKGFAHRDIKPSNVILDERTGRYKITDFGLASATQETVTRATQSDDLAGTVQYMSPEQIRTPSRTDHRADIYSLGVVLFEMLTGERPFRGTGHALLMDIAHEEIPGPRHLYRATPRLLEVIVLRCLAKEPFLRYASAKEVADDLDRFLRGEPIMAKPAGLLERAFCWCRRRPWQAIAAGLAVLFMILIAWFGVSSTIAKERESRARANAEQFRRKAEETREEESKQRRLAEREKLLAETWQCQFLYRLALDELADRRLDKARRYVDRVPASQRSWDTRRLAYLAMAQPVIRQTMTGGHWAILGAARSPDGERLVSCDASGRVLLWDLSTGGQLRVLAEGIWSERHRLWLHYLHVRASGKDWRESGPCYCDPQWVPGTSSVVAASFDGQAVGFDTQTGKTTVLISPQDTQQPLFSAAVSADGELAAFGGAHGTVFVQELPGEQGRISKYERDGDGAEAAATAIHWCETAKGWIVGWSDGSVELLQGSKPQRRTATQLPGPVWTVDLKETDGATLLAIGVQEPDVHLFEISKDRPDLKPAGRLVATADAGKHKSIHAVGFSSSGDDVWAIDNMGRLTVWELQEQQVRWSVQAVRSDMRVEPDTNVPKGLPAGLQGPLPFQRAGSVVLPGHDGRSVLSAGRDAVIQVWDLARATDGRGRVMPARAGDRPSVTFDRFRPEILWAVDRNGRLTAFDTRTGNVVDRVDAHKGGAADLTVAAGDTAPILTVGGDSCVRFWKLKGKRIAPAHVREITFDNPLLGVAVSPGNKYLATMDDTGLLDVRDFKSGDRVFSHKPDASSSIRPLTGRLAFGRAGDRTLLAAFGSGQSCHIFEVDPFAGPVEQAWIAGQGGTALVWDLNGTGILFAADDHPRYEAHGFGPKPITVDRGRIGLPASTCVAVVATPDGRRILALEEKGRLVVVDARQMIRLVDLDTGVEDASDMALDAAGQRLAVAAADGSVRILETDREDSSDEQESDDVTDRWQLRSLVEPTPAIPQVDYRSVQLDPLNRLCLLVVKSVHGQQRGEGPLYFLRDDGSTILQERLEPALDAMDRRATHGGSSLAFQPGGEPIVFMRRRSGKQSYDGTIHLGTRRGKEDWDFEQILAHGNEGFAGTLVVDEKGHATDAFWFRFSFFSMIHATPARKPGQDWNLETVGLAGDGLHCRSQVGSDGRVHFLFRQNRFNADPAGNAYGLWDGEAFHREVIDPAAHAIGDIELLPDGRPAVMVSRYIGDKAELESAILARGPSGWSVVARLPVACQRAGLDFAVGSDGEIYLTSIEMDKGELRLWCHRKGVWTCRTVCRDFPHGQPSWRTVLVDRRGQPLVAVGQLHKPFGWLGVVRPKER